MRTSAKSADLPVIASAASAVVIVQADDVIVAEITS
jgi:hypothetical protein